MGLSTKLVSIDDHGLDNWTSSSQNSLPEPPSIRRKPPPKPEPLKCPRCCSTSTKFCYYNNYNKSQPRHYCKGCKRHWTEGGTLRNVPVGGGRKNKLLRPTDPVNHIPERKKEVKNQRCPLISMTASSMPGVTIRENSTNMDEEIKNENDIFYETINLPSSSSLPYDIFSSLKLSIPQDGNTHFSFSYDNVPCSIIPNSSTTRSSNIFNEYLGKFDSTMEESTITTVMPITSSSDLLSHQPWKVPETGNDLITNENMSSNYWNLNEFDTLSTVADLDIQWDDLEIKP
ncbi:hypothetical protein K7X08_018145 [Anisodus acutangulus]|uniref:Dof zinc finger protein n=1 Tax=Anisodus acutangulus TaxID=402998 RepID=A0A9Q1LVH3_9SOLA|nr:hypothetical protein K7X08_018145 [Anisodus acutangulus]